MVRKQTLLVYMLMMVQLVVAQNSTLFMMSELPQCNFVNPAIQSNAEWVIGVPALASIHTHHTNTISTFNDAFYKKADGTSVFDYDRVISGMEGNEILVDEHNYTMFFAGLLRGDNFYTFAVNERALAVGTVPAELMQLLWEGNANYDEVSLKGLSIKADHMREYIFGWSRKMSSSLTLGGHAKVIFGKSNLCVSDVSGVFVTDPTDYSVNLNINAVVHSTLPIVVESDAQGILSDVTVQDDINWWDYAMENKNVGLGFDVGFIYKKDSKTTISGSLLNVGTIGWRSESNGISVDGEYQLSEIESASSFSEIADSIEANIPLKTNTDNYTSLLMPEIYLGVSRKLSPHLNAGLTVYNRIIFHKLYPSLTLSLNTYNYKRFTAALSYTLEEENYFNIGAGIGVKLGSFRLHAMSDNVRCLFSLADSRFINFRVGLSYVINERYFNNDCGCYERWQGRKKRKTKY